MTNMETTTFTEFINKAVELLKESENIFEIFIKGKKTNVRITKPKVEEINKYNKREHIKL